MFLRSWIEWIRRAPPGALAVGSGGTIVLSRLALQGELGVSGPFVLTWPAVMLAAFLGGFWSVMTVSGLGLAVGLWILSAGGGRPVRPIGVLFYLTFALFFAIAAGARERAAKQAAADAERLSEMQHRLARVARLNAMGEIAATLAHELNQPLTAIASYAGAAQMLVERDPADSAAVADLLKKVGGQAARARDIIGRIRGYVTLNELALTAHSLSEMFEESVAAVVAGTGSPIAARRDFDPTVDRVLADRIQIQQVMVNLIRNAVEAMAEAPRRELRIGGRPSADGLVEAYVSDTGPGLPADVAQRLFEPFVTGKADGMGIGLSVSRSIVEAHGGVIRGESDPGGGAVFRFTLRPATAEAAP
jgi:C4-dicarboxylate-specific signal transduction histidine kinase